MLFVFKVFLIASLIQMTVRYDPLQERPWLLAVIYALGVTMFDAMGWVSPSLGMLALRVAAAFLLSWLYFWLLAKLMDTGALWWLVVLLGLPIILL